MSLGDDIRKITGLSEGQRRVCGILFNGWGASSVLQNINQLRGEYLRKMICLQKYSKWHWITLQSNRMSKLGSKYKWKESIIGGTIMETID